MIFFTDLDETLLSSDKSISPGNKAALEEVLAGGHAVCISTGRALPSALRQARFLGLDGENCYVISYNGSQLYDCQKKEVIFRAGLPIEIVRFIFDEAHAYGIHIQTYNDQGVVTEAFNKTMQRYCDIQGLPYTIADDFRDEVVGNPPKVLAVDPDHEKILAFREYMKPKVGETVDMFLSHPDMLEFVPPGINKGQAVAFLCKYLGLPIEDSVAAGDAENDLSMIQAAGVGCAMINGEEIVKTYADYVTINDCDHDGVAEILHRYILK